MCQQRSSKKQFAAVIFHTCISLSTWIWQMGYLAAFSKGIFLYIHSGWNQVHCYAPGSYTLGPQKMLFLEWSNSGKANLGHNFFDPTFIKTKLFKPSLPEANGSSELFWTRLLSSTRPAWKNLNLSVFFFLSFLQIILQDLIMPQDARYACLGHLIPRFTGHS